MSHYVSVRYNPKHQYQLVKSDPHGGVNCTAYCCAMALDGATLGGMIVTGERVRALSSEPTPDPRSPGLNLPQIIAVSQKLHVPLEDRSGRGWAQLVRDLDAGRYVVLQGVYGILVGADSCMPAFDGGHAIVLTHRYTAGTAKGTANVHDPLCRTDKKISLAHLRAYGEKLSPSLRYAVTRSTPSYAKLVR